MASWDSWNQSSQYCWVVICKNKKFHRHDNLFFGHKIPLGETDALESPPLVGGEFSVCCDECGKEYFYQSKQLLRTQLELPVAFTPHPLFR